MSDDYASRKTEGCRQHIPVYTSRYSSKSNISAVSTVAIERYMIKIFRVISLNYLK